MRSISLLLRPIFQSQRASYFSTAMPDVQEVECKRSKVDNGDRPTLVLKFSKLSPDAIKPTRGSALAAGYDLYAAHDFLLTAKGRGVVKTDIQVS